MENYLFDVPTAALVSQVSEDEIQNRVLACVLANKSDIFKKNKFLEFLADQIKKEDLTPDRLAKLDASTILKDFLRLAGKDVRAYVREYIDVCAKQKRLDKVFPEVLVKAILNSSEKTDSRTVSTTGPTA